ncbi:unnamed protein product, partial [Ixodes hexagonus]
MNGSIELGRNFSKVSLFNETAGVEAFSGYITINATDLTNYFFLLTKSKNISQRETPLVLWLFGGPGLSSLMAQFLYNGPVAINATGNITQRENTLTKFADVIYLDQPAGAGFSFTNQTGYSQTMEQMSANILIFLEQFLQIFPEYNGSDFYIAGESYAARNAFHLGYTMLVNETLNNSLSMSGVISGVPFLGPVLDMLDPTEFLYQVGMLDANGKIQFEGIFQQIRELVNNKSSLNYTMMGLQLLSQTILNTDPAAKTLYQNLTGFMFDASALYSTMPSIIMLYYAVVNSTAVKRMLHVGENASIEVARPLVVLNIAYGDFSRDLSNETGYVLNNTKVLNYYSQFDTVCPVVKSEEHFRNITWIESRTFLNQSRSIVYKPNTTEVTHYRTDTTNLTYVLVTRAGHYVSLDKGPLVYRLIKEFV